MTTTETISLIAAVGALGTTLFLPTLKGIFGFQGERLSDAASIRKYMQDELAKRDTRIAAFEAEAEKWRNLYYEQLGINQKQASEIIILHSDNAELAEKVTQLQDLVAKNAGIVQHNADNVSKAMDVAKTEINKL